MAATPQPVEVEVLTGPPGCGKSTELRAEAVRKKGLYLFFLPTIPLIREQAAALRQEAKWVEVYEVHSESPGRGAVQRKLRDLRSKLEAAGTEHAVILTTHEALMGGDFIGFESWHARIDEAPNAVKGGDLRVAKAIDYFKANYDLEPVEAPKPMAVVVPKGPPPNPRDIEKEVLLTPLIDFTKRASTPSGVFVEAISWDGLTDLKWWSIWTPTALRNFASIRIAGASYETSLGAIVVERWFPHLVRLKPVPIAMTRCHTPSVRIHYFTQGHKPSSTFWDSATGRLMLSHVADFLRASVPELGFWSGNKEVLKYLHWRVGGQRVRPRVAGQNAWRTLTSCALIYTSGATPHDRPFMEAVGITDDEVRHAREDEDFLQFAMRGAIRNKDFNGAYDIYVYEREQAQRLAARLEASSVGIVEIVPEPSAGIMDDPAFPVPEFDDDEEAREATSPASKKPKRTNAATRAPLARVPNPKTGKMILPRSEARARQRAAKNAGQPPKRRGRRPKARPIT